MSYKLRKPISSKQRMEFLVKYADSQMLRVVDTDLYLFALEPNEMMGEKEVEGKVIPYPVINPNYEQEQAEKERQRIQSLTCTKRVFALMLQQLGITYSRLKELIATNEQAQLEWDLCVELQRSNPLLDIMGAYLQITPEQIDILFRVANGELPLEDLQATVQQPEVNEEVEE